MSFGLISAGTAAEDRGPTNKEFRKVLFIGNSYTFFNDLDVVLKNLAASARPRVKLLTARLAKGSATLESHYADPEVKALISRMKWDVVVLQEQSMRPVQNPTAFFEYARKMGAVVKERGARPAFFMTWARKHKPDMTKPLAQAYTRAGRQVGALVAPVGLAWAASLTANPEINLYCEDQSHPSVHGTYLAACVFYAVLTGQSPVGLSNAGLAGITAEQAKVLQQTAWKTVQSYADKHPAQK